MEEILPGFLNLEAKVRNNSQKRHKQTQQVRCDNLKIFGKVSIHKGFSLAAVFLIHGTVIVILYSNRDKERKRKTINKRSSY